MRNFYFFNKRIINVAFFFITVSFWLVYGQKITYNLHTFYSELNFDRKNAFLYLCVFIILFSLLLGNIFKISTPLFEESLESSKTGIKSNLLAVEIKDSSKDIVLNKKIKKKLSDISLIHGSDFVDWLTINKEIPNNVKIFDKFLDENIEIWNQNSLSLEQKVRHEIAHALVIESFGGAVTEISINKNGKVGGYVNFIAPIPIPKTVDVNWMNIHISIAGQIIDSKYGDKYFGSEFDMKKTMANCISILAINERPTEYFDDLNIEKLIFKASENVSKMLDDNMLLINHCVNELLIKKSFTGLEFKELLKNYRNENKL